MRKFIVKKSGIIYEAKTFPFKRNVLDKPAKIKKVANKQNKNSTESK